MATRLTSKGQVTIPRAVRESLRVGPGDEVEFHTDESGTVRVARSDRVTRLEAVFREIAASPPMAGITAEDILSKTRGDDR